MTGSMYYSCSLANKQTRLHVPGIGRASRTNRFVKLAFTSKVSPIWSLTSKDSFPSANRNVILTYRFILFCELKIELRWALIGERLYPCTRCCLCDTNSTCEVFYSLLNLHRLWKMDFCLCICKGNSRHIHKYQADSIS